MYYKRMYYDDETTEIHELEVLNSINYELQYNEAEELQVINIYVNGFRTHVIECETDDDAKFNLKVVNLFIKCIEKSISDDVKVLDLNMLFNKCTSIIIDEEDLIDEDEENE